MVFQIFWEEPRSELEMVKPLMEIPPPAERETSPVDPWRLVTPPVAEIVGFWPGVIVIFSPALML